MQNSSAPSFTNSFQSRILILNLYNLRIPWNSSPINKGGKPSLKDKGTPLSRESKQAGCFQISISLPSLPTFPTYSHKASKLLGFSPRET